MQKTIAIDADTAKAMLHELEMAHQILKNALAIMSLQQKMIWAEKNDRDSLIEYGTTRAGERADVIAQARRVIK